MIEARGHEPVLVRECLWALAVRPGGRYVDGTLGLGGHARAVLEASAPDGRVLGVDRDAELLPLARANLAGFGDRAVVWHGSYAEIGRALMKVSWRNVDGILLDLGVCSVHLDDATRGFSFSREAPLDMRFDRALGESARAWLERVDDRVLADALVTFAEERRPARVVRAIRDAIRRKTLNTTRDLADIARATMRGSRTHHPGTRLFQAIRIAVNRELDELHLFLEKMADWVSPGGRVAIIAYHSLEDRPVKEAFRRLAQGGDWELLSKKVVRPGPDETRHNRRARSARLRAIARTGVS
ncbi:MAG: 16S rRNA (cytosine(1402)-N(4))-methyltransferase RsmH [Deltaproteobacteria bacterium]|nr:16S rRNA (cytosine(1402)-N(4))-methyltransferase RsmH [Deltaproteobacteria bacterium]